MVAKVGRPQQVPQYLLSVARAAPGSCPPHHQDSHQDGRWFAVLLWPITFLFVFFFPVKKKRKKKETD
jgi:hypothetical protein